MTSSALNGLRENIPRDLCRIDLHSSPSRAIVLVNPIINP